MSTIHRMPRPMGMTQAMVEYKHTNDPALFDRIQGYFIQQWLINNQELCGRVMSTMELAQFLHCDQEKIRLQMRDQLLSTKLWDKDKQDQLIEAMMGQQVAWALEDRMAVEKQFRDLQKSQGSKYTPFVTSEVNKALGLKLQSTVNLGGILKSLQGGGSINIFNNQNNVNVDEQVSVEKAIQIIGEENARIADSSQDLKYLENEHQLEALPEVVATKQTGVNIEKEGLSISSGDLDKIADSYKDILSEADGTHHEMRREIEEQIDTSEDDPEMEIYPG